MPFEAIGAVTVKFDGTDYEQTLYRLWSVVALGEGSAALFEAMDLFDEPAELFEGLTRPGDLPDEVRKKLTPEMKRAGKIPLEEAEKVFDFCDKNNIDIIIREHEDYPERLMNLYRPPALLFVKGDIRGLDSRLSISVVGARKASDYSLKVTSAIVRTLSNHGFDIVSGFAEGVDICAHLSAVKSGTRTYAVLGTGVDVEYPRKNVKYREIIEANGAFISEYLPGTAGMSGNFPQRNRILTALSLGTAVIEASAKSGSLSSATQAAELSKPVFVVPPCDLFDKRYEGNAELIRLGLMPMMGARDIYSEYCVGMLGSIEPDDPVMPEINRLRQECFGVIKGEIQHRERKAVSGKDIRQGVAAARRRAKEQAEAEEAAKAAGKQAMTEAAALQAVSGELEGDEAKVVESLAAAGRPMRPDEVAMAVECDIDDVLELLTGLEIRGIVRTEEGRYSPAEGVAPAVR